MAPPEKSPSSSGTEMPASKPLQIFLLFALIITGAAYVTDQWMNRTRENSMTRLPNPYRQRVQAQNQFLIETKLGQEAEAKKKYADAVLHYRRALQAQPCAGGYLNLGNALLTEGNPEMAFSQYKAAAKMDPDNAAVYLAWGNALLREGKRDEAVQLYQSALQRNPKLAAVHYQLALEFLREQKAALVAQKQDVKENHAAAAARSGAEAQMAGANAARHFAAAAAAGFSTAEFWQSYGILLNRQGNYHEAEICLTKAEALQPGSAETELQWASADYHQNKDAGAIDHFGLALSLAPNDPAALNGLALLYATARDAEIRSPKMAILLATRACDGTNADNPQFLDTLARAYAADGDFFQAIAAEDHAVRRAAEAGDHRLLREIQPRFALFVQHKPE